MFDNLGKNVPTELAISLARGNLTELVTNLDSDAINKSERKMSGKECVRAGKRFTYLFRMNIWMIL